LWQVLVMKQDRKMAGFVIGKGQAEATIAKPTPFPTLYPLRQHRTMIKPIMKFIVPNFGWHNILTGNNVI
jgi:hypothetical protein